MQACVQAIIIVIFPPMSFHGLHLCWFTHYEYVMRQLYVWTKPANRVCSKVINFVLSPLMVAHFDSFSKFVLTQAIFVAPTLYN